jgi:hypothetical protein
MRSIKLTPKYLTSRRPRTTEPPIEQEEELQDSFNSGARMLGNVLIFLTAALAVGLLALLVWR